MPLTLATRFLDTEADGPAQDIVGLRLAGADFRHLAVMTFCCLLESRHRAVVIRVHFIVLLKPFFVVHSLARFKFRSAAEP